MTPTRHPTQRRRSSAEHDERMQKLARRLDIAFRDRSLLETALTHRSAGSVHNERLEFLGDAILNFHVAARLYEASPASREGRLTRLRATLVRRETLAELARELELGAFLNLGGGELKSGGRDRDSILADAFEALVGAIYLDQGQTACWAWLDGRLLGRMQRVLAEPATKDYKTQLQETLQGRGLPLPEYVVVAEGGTAHKRVFEVECRVPQAGVSSSGTGDSRRRAEQAAARRVLQQVRDA